MEHYYNSTEITELVNKVNKLEKRVDEPEYDRRDSSSIF